jgi:NAD+ synthase (glutamine-hydrolysing)
VAVIRLALAQMNPTVGALSANAAAIAQMAERARDLGCDHLITPELALSGYPPEDLLLKEGFVEDVHRALDELATLDVGAMRVHVGTPYWVEDDSPFTDHLARATDARYAATAVGWRRVGRVANALVTLGDVGPPVFKQLLPNYDVFDEQRYFHAGLGSTPRDGVGLLVCEDVWPADGPAKRLAGAGARVLLVANASPFAIGHHGEREAMLQRRAIETGCVIAYVNMVGGQDELVFDGRSVVVDVTGRVIARAAAFEEELLVVDVEMPDSPSRERPVITTRIADDLEGPGEVYGALVLGTRDYVRKNGFERAVVNLSGGIDSSIVTVIAADALGADKVRVFAQPSRYSSEGSVSDAYDLAARCGVAITTIPIEPAHQALATSLADALGDEIAGLTDENLQSRVRGLLLMAISNDTGAIVLTTGNKSELATGYFTLYGDSAGGFAVIKDVAKTLVYELCRWRNELAASRGEVEPIPVSVIDKPPSAELRPDQRDDQSLPPYEVLDPILELYVEGDHTARELIERGFDPALVMRVARLVDLNEYKRRQTPPGVRITPKAFGKDRRMPITNAYRAGHP